MEKKCEDLADGVKLRLLRAAGGPRPWGSLDELRECVLCEQAFNGRQVRILWDRDGKTHLRCPTPGCAATPNQWVHPGNPLLSTDAWNDWMRLLDTLCDGPAPKDKLTRSHTVGKPSRGPTRKIRLGTAKSGPRASV